MLPTAAAGGPRGTLAAGILRGGSQGAACQGASASNAEEVRAVLVMHGSRASDDVFSIMGARYTPTLNSLQVAFPEAACPA